MKHVAISLSTSSPLAIRSDHAPGGLATAPYIPGTTFLGSLAAAHRMLRGDQTQEFEQLFLSGKIQYPNLYPGQNPSPRPPQIEHHQPADQPEQVHSRRPPRNPKDILQIKCDADELARLAGQVPQEINQVEKGLVSRDLNEQLKRIEKLSKRIRRELNP